MYLHELSGSKFHSVTTFCTNDVKNSIFIKSGCIWFWKWALQMWNLAPLATLWGSDTHKTADFSDHTSRWRSSLYASSVWREPERRWRMGRRRTGRQTGGISACCTSSWTSPVSQGSPPHQTRSSATEKNTISGCNITTQIFSITHYLDASHHFFKLQEMPYVRKALS